MRPSSKNRGVRATNMEGELYFAQQTTICWACCNDWLSDLNSRSYCVCRWMPDIGCLHCINSSNVDPTVRVMMAVYVEETSPFLRLALDSLASQTLAAEQVSVVVAIESGRSSERYAAIVANWSRDHAVRSYHDCQHLIVSTASRSDGHSCCLRVLASFDLDTCRPTSPGSRCFPLLTPSPPTRPCFRLL